MGESHEDCVFCKILAGEHGQSETIVYRDALVSAFMDRRQPHPGHVLVIPNEHRENLFLLTEDLAGHLFRITYRVAKQVKALFSPQGMDLYQCNEACAGQTVFHFHMHIFPRSEGDGLFDIYPHGAKEPETLETLEALAQALRELL